VAWTCPSNIALIKYWGKRDVQIPMNPSLSLTLREARTTTRIGFTYDPAAQTSLLSFRFEGRESPAFEKRIRTYIKGMESLVPVLKFCSLEIDSENTFPHSSGIASSASAMGALALCLVQLETHITGNTDPERFWQKASLMARLGSGSASRSIFPGFSLWGSSDSWEGSSDEYAIPVRNYHDTFKNLRDFILVVESGQKPVSSSAGHKLMNSNPYAGKRFDQARANLSLLQSVLKEGDWEAFITIVEEEALSLHAMMMTSQPGYILMQPGTLSILHKIRKYREESNHRPCFTLDAGANVHLLCADADADAVEDFIKSDLLKYCEDGRVIFDRMGQGPYKSHGQ
jgi:diphosphomevalonate decarboxylase